MTKREIALARARVRRKRAAQLKQRRAYRALKLLETVARFTKDRELTDDGMIFDMPNDDAVLALHDTIDEARAITGIPARRSADDVEDHYDAEETERGVLE